MKNKQGLTFFKKGISYDKLEQRVLAQKNKTFKKEKKMPTVLMCLGVFFLFLLAVALWVFVPRLTSALALFGLIIYINSLFVFPDPFFITILVLCIIGAVVSVYAQIILFKEDIRNFWHD